MSPPVVSVCIPVLNGGRFVAAAVMSCLAQSFREFEVVVFDNGSTDGTAEIVGQINDPRVRLFSSDVTVPIEQSWNSVVKASQGEFVKLLCADDILAPTCLERQLAELRAPANARAVFAFSPRRIIASNGNTLLRGRPYQQRNGIVSSGQATENVIRMGRNIFGEPLAVLFRRAAYSEAGGFRGERPYCIDLDLWCRMLEFGDAVFVREEAGAFRVSEDSLSVRLVGQQSRQQSEFLLELYRRKAGCNAWHYYLLGRCRSYVRVAARAALYVTLGLLARSNRFLKYGHRS
jgi:glycosyltransferase involved in cell wall biosynthesis